MLIFLTSVTLCVIVWASQQTRLAQAVCLTDQMGFIQEKSLKKIIIFLQVQVAQKWHTSILMDMKS